MILKYYLESLIKVCLRKSKKINIPQSLDELNEEGKSLELEDISKNILKIIENSKNKENILNAVNSLNDEEKTIFFLHFEEGMTFDEISKSFNISLNTIKSKYRRSLGKLKILLEKMHQNKN